MYYSTPQDSTSELLDLKILQRPLQSSGEPNPEQYSILETHNILFHFILEIKYSYLFIQTTLSFSLYIDF